MALPEKIHVEIVTPERRVVARDVDEIILPGSVGSFGVLPGHAPLFAHLAPGVAQIKGGGRDEVFAISGGFADVGPEQVTVLAETCERAAEIDRERAQRKLDELQSKLKHEIPAADVEVVRLKLLKQLARLHATERAS